MSDHVNKDGRFRRFLRQLGPGLITGVSDDDPSGIATFAQAGAKFGLSLLAYIITLFFIHIPVREVFVSIVHPRISFGQHPHFEAAQGPRLAGNGHHDPDVSRNGRELVLIFIFSCQTPVCAILC